MRDLESQVSKKSFELQLKDDAIRQIDVDVRDMQSQIESEEKMNEMLRSEIDGLKRDLDSMRDFEEKSR